MDEVRLKRLRFRAWRRGFLEADLVLGPFADSHAQSLTETELAAFERLLDRPTRTSTAGSSRAATPPDDDEALLVSRIRAFHASPARAASAPDPLRKHQVCPWLKTSSASPPPPTPCN